MLIKDKKNNNKKTKKRTSEQFQSDTEQKKVDLQGKLEQKKTELQRELERVEEETKKFNVDVESFMIDSNETPNEIDELVMPERLQIHDMAKYCPINHSFSVGPSCLVCWITYFFCCAWMGFKTIADWITDLFEMLYDWSTKKEYINSHIIFMLFFCGLIFACFKTPKINNNEINHLTLDERIELYKTFGATNTNILLRDVFKLIKKDNSNIYLKRYYDSDYDPIIELLSNPSNNPNIYDFVKSLDSVISTTEKRELDLVERKIVSDGKIFLGNLKSYFKLDEKRDKNNKDKKHNKSKKEVLFQIIKDEVEYFSRLGGERIKTYKGAIIEKYYQSFNGANNNTREGGDQGSSSLNDDKSTDFLGAYMSFLEEIMFWYIETILLLFKLAGSIAHYVLENYQ